MNRNSIQNFINHIVFVIDKSTSMADKKGQVVKVVDSQVEYFAQRSKELNQETRISVYLFSDKNSIECLIYDMDVLRLPSIEGFYKPEGWTALIAAQLKALDDLSKTATLYGDHAFLCYTFTDGQENRSGILPSVLSDRLSSLPENWSVGVFVPDQKGVFEAKKCGYAPGNIAVWDTTKSFAEVGNEITRSTETFMINRSKGIRGTKSLFKVDVKFNAVDVKKNLDELSKSMYQIYRVHSDMSIREFISQCTSRPFVAGCGYYQLTKPEEVQDYKLICIRDFSTDRVYSGANARAMLGLPAFGMCKIKPGDFKQFEIYIQSTSVNRKLLRDTKLLVIF